MTFFDPPEHVIHILRRLTENGHAAFLVGGCVRDAVMARPVHDWDVTTSAAPVDVALLFPKTVITGEKFGTVTVVVPDGAIEVTTFRVEGEYLDGRRPRNVEFVPNLDEDLGRRDFTMNAMAVSVEGEFIDLFGGIEDIRRRLIRCVGGPNTRFSEDALRMFRALRFSAQLGFEIEKETMSAVYANVDRAKLLSAERVRVEVEKTLMSHKPEIVGDMIKVGLLARYVETSGKVPDGVERIEDLPAETIMRWCALCAILLRGGFIASATDFLQKMRLDGKTAGICARAISMPCITDDRAGVKRLFYKNGVAATRCAAAIQDVLQAGEDRADGRVTALDRAEEIIASGECFSLNKLAVSGSDLIGLGYSPGHELGEKLDMLLEHVLENPRDNTRQTLLNMVSGG